MPRDRADVTSYMHPCGGKRAAPRAGRVSTANPHDDVAEQQVGSQGRQRRLSCQMLCEHDMTVRAISRLEGSGRPDQAPPAPEITPPPQWIPKSQGLGSTQHFGLPTSSFSRHNVPVSSGQILNAGRNRTGRKPSREARPSRPRRRATCEMHCRSHRWTSRCAREAWSTRRISLAEGLNAAKL